jgi:hypothetical protein
VQYTAVLFLALWFAGLQTADSKEVCQQIKVLVKLNCLLILTSRPTNQKENKGRSPAKGQDVSPCKIKEYLSMKRVDGFGKKKRIANSSCGHAYINGSEVLA